MAAANEAATLDPKSPAPTEAKKKLDMTTLRKFLPLIGFVVIVAFFAIVTGGAILTPKNIRLTVSGGYMLMIAACGVWMIMAMGCLDFSQGSLLGVSCAVVCALSGINPALAIVGGIVCGGVIGAVNAFFHVHRQIQSFVVTICMMFLLRGVCAYLTTESPVYGAQYLTDLNTMEFLMPVTLAVLVITYVVTRFTSLGHNLKAIGANEKAARFAGIKVQKTKTLIYIAAGCITGFAAFVNAIRVGSVTSTAGNMFETQLLIAMVLGGMPINGGAQARFSNVVIGVLSYIVLQKGLVMMGFTTEIQQLILGVVFILMLALFSDRSSNQVIK